MGPWHKLAAVFMMAAYARAQSGGVLLDVPFVAQPEEGCGAAAIAMLMQYWHRELPVAPVAPRVEELKTLITPEAHGIYASKLESFLRSQGYKTFAIRGEWSDLEEQLSKGRPILAALQTKGGPTHYVVLTGLDPSADAIVKNDPAVRKSLRQRRREFLEQWKRAGNWMLLALPS